MRYRTPQPAWDAVGLARLVDQGLQPTDESVRGISSSPGARRGQQPSSHPEQSASSRSCRRAGVRLPGRVVVGVRLLDNTPDNLVDAVAELAGEQDRDQRWYVWADKLAALGIASPAVVADGAVVEVVDDPLP